MAERNEQVQDRVREELSRQPTLGSRELFEMVKEMDSSFEEIPLASFHARYVLPVKREQAAQRAQTGSPAGERKQSQPRKRTQRRGKQAAEETEEPAESEATPEPRKRARKQASRTAQPAAGEQAPARGTSEGGGREQIRAVFMEFAREFSEAESRTEIVQVLSKVDEYVERVLQQGK